MSVPRPSTSILSGLHGIEEEFAGHGFRPYQRRSPDALAEIVGTALELVNYIIADYDRSADLARGATRPHPPAIAMAEQADDEQENEHCRDCERILRIDDPVDTDAADGRNGYCGT